MNTNIPRVAVVGIGEDGLEAARQLIYDGIAETCLTDLDTEGEKSELELPHAINLVLILGTVGTEKECEALFNPAMLSNRTLNIAVITTMRSDESCEHSNSSMFQKLIMAPVDACFPQYMRTRLFNAEGGRARINALCNISRNILEMMTETDFITIPFGDFEKTMAEAGQVWLSIGMGSGNDRAIKAAGSALVDLFSGNQLLGARKILLRVAGNSLLLSEVNDVLDVIQSNVKTDTEIIFGVVRKPIPDSFVKVSLLATHYSVAFEYSKTKIVTNKMHTKRFTSQERTLVHTWVDQWLNLIDLMNRVTGTEEPPFSPPPPTALDEIEYTLLRSWFLEHEEGFLPLWRNFSEHRKLPHDTRYTESIEEPETEKYENNPFLYFYEPENLYGVAVQLYLQNSDAIWEPSEERASVMRSLIVRTGELMVELSRWIEDHSENT